MRVHRIEPHRLGLKFLQNHLQFARLDRLANDKGGLQDIPLPGYGGLHQDFAVVTRDASACGLAMVMRQPCNRQDAPPDRPHSSNSLFAPTPGANLMAKRGDSMLVNGVWQERWQPVQQEDGDGRFIRQTSSFRNWVTADGSAGITGDGGFKAEPGRYHLYAAYICPWASRALMARHLKGLADVVSVSVVNPVLTDQGWAFGGFGGSDDDTLNGARYMHELYTRADPHFSGRATVPVLWDKQTGTIVNNESADIVRMFNSAFTQLDTEAGAVGPDLYPTALQADIDALNNYLYDHLNNGVYQAGFATTQFAYQEAYARVFAALDEMESRLSDGRAYLFGDAFTESDIRLFVTLVRFDAAYFSLFKCNRNTIKEMPNLNRYLQRILTLDGVRETVRLDHIKAGYYSIKALNPTGIVPQGQGTL